MQVCRWQAGEEDAGKETGEDRARGRGGEEEEEEEEERKSHAVGKLSGGLEKVTGVLLRILEVGRGPRRAH